MKPSDELRATEEGTIKPKSGIGELGRTTTTSTTITTTADERGIEAESVTRRSGDIDSVTNAPFDPKQVFQFCLLL